MNNFVKSHGLGNDYIILDEKSISFNLTPKTTKIICHRNYGIGSDGILVLTNKEENIFGLKILNPDGSEAEKSGNGLRIFAKFLFEHDYTNSRNFNISTLGGIVTAELETKEDLVKYVTVEMGNAVFKSTDIPVSGDEREVINEEIRVDGDIYNYTGVSVGNPHCVIFTDELSEKHIRLAGPLLENHSLFPNRINVQFAKVVSRELVEILIWERGAGYTLASGSSSCAVAAACVKNDLTENKVTVSMPGGILDIEIRDDWSIKMRGPVEEISSGTMSSDLIEKLENPSKIDL